MGLQRVAGAAAIGFGNYPDEAAHYLSGLMIRDYLLSGFKQSPIDYVSNYYLHLSMIGIGHWPPFFYVVQAAWMLVYGYTRGDVLIFVAATTALTSLTVCLATRESAGLARSLDHGGNCTGDSDHPVEQLRRYDGHIYRDGHPMGRVVPGQVPE